MSAMEVMWLVVASTSRSRTSCRVTGSQVVVSTLTTTDVPLASSDAAVSDALSGS